jgi:maleate isomerase
LRPAAFGFACTGSSYLVGRAAEVRIVQRLEEQYGYPILTATAAIMGVLEGKAARRIAIASPYPPALAEAARAYWSDAGYEVVEIRRIDTSSDDTRRIYALGSADARVAASALRELEVDAVLISGTGLPSLQLIAEDVKGPPLLSSNLCLAERLSVAIHLPGLNRERWRQRLVEAIAPLRSTT